MIEGIRCQALLDTGSTITTVSQKFHTENLSQIPIYKLDELLNIECPDGNLLPYVGYIEASITITEKSDNVTILLVVPDTDYNERVPVLLGTNILRPITESCQSCLCISYKLWQSQPHEG